MVQKFDFLVSAIDLIEAQYFEDAAHIWYFNKIRDYFIDYHVAPTGTVLKQELRESVATGTIRKEDLRSYAEVFPKLFKPVDETDYLIKKVVSFCRRQAIRKAFLEYAPKVDNDDDELWEKIQSGVSDACNVGAHSLDLGHQYLSEYDDRLAQRRDGDDIATVPTGIQDLDNLIGGGLKAGQLGIWMAGTGRGKCLENGTQVIKWDGSLVNVEDVCVGDQLMGPDSTPREVLSTVSGEEELFEVVPVKGDAWRCTKDHLLTLVHTVTGELSDMHLDDYLCSNNKFKHCHKLVMTGVNFPAQESLPLAPYFLGVWLGDGSKCLGNSPGRARIPHVAVTTMDPEIESAIREVASDFGLSVRVEDNVHRGQASTYFVTGRTWQGVGHVSSGGRGRWVNPLLDLLRSVVGPEAKIPRQYLTASREDRLALLAGFLDTDGSLKDGCGYEITQKRRDYIDDIAFLSRSLGLRASLGEKVINGVSYWRLHIYGDCTGIPTRISRKKAGSRRQKKNHLRTGIREVRSVGVRPYSGFMLGADHRFLLSDFTVTHNSIALPHCGKRAVVEGLNVVHYTLELDEQQISTRYDAAWSGIHLDNLVDQEAAVAKKMRHLHTKWGNSLVIKFYPTRTVGISALKAHIRQLKSIDFDPGMVLVDYGDLLKPTAGYNDEYSDLGTIFADLRGIAGELSIPIWTATQVNRAGFAADVVDVDTIGDSFRKAQIADVVVAICMTKEERADEKARLYLAKNRNGPTGVSVDIDTDYGRMCFARAVKRPDPQAPTASKTGRVGRRVQGAVT